MKKQISMPFSFYRCKVHGGNTAGTSAGHLVVLAFRHIYLPRLQILGGYFFMSILT